MDSVTPSSDTNGRSNVPPGVSLRGAIRSHLSPQTVDTEPVLYSGIQESPSELINADGNYQPGWFRSFDGRLNVQESPAGKRRFHRWFYIHFDAGDFFVGANIADLALGGNSGIVVLDKRTGKFEVASQTGLIVWNGVQISPDCRHFMDHRNHSRLEINDDDSTVVFDLRVRGFRLSGRASALFDPFVQSTAFHAGHGTLQSWGNLTLDHGWLETPHGAWELEPGAMGIYDRSLGHRRPIENWNWLVTSGTLEVDDSQDNQFALHLAVDQTLARPRVDSQKACLWVAGKQVKLTGVTIAYACDEETKDTGEWRIQSAGDGAGRIDLRFSAKHHRRDKHQFPFLMLVDHNQYFGEVTGRVELDGASYEIRSAFGTAEDSLMII